MAHTPLPPFSAPFARPVDSVSGSLVIPLYGATPETLEAWNDEWLNLAETVYQYRRSLLEGELSAEQRQVFRDASRSAVEGMSALYHRMKEHLV